VRDEAGCGARVREGKGMGRDGEDADRSRWGDD
jgi:hypothetical protein